MICVFCSKLLAWDVPPVATLLAAVLRGLARRGIDDAAHAAVRRLSGGIRELVGQRVLVDEREVIVILLRAGQLLVRPTR